MIIQICLGIIAGGFSFAIALYFCYMLQLESYQVKGYYRWLGEAAPRILLGLTGLTALYMISAYILLFFKGTAGYIVGGLLLTAFFVSGTIFLRRLNEKNAKSLVYTARVKRLLITLGILILVCMLLSLQGQVIILGLLLLLSPLLIVFANFINTPIENGVKRHYLNDAEKKLQERPDLIKIGITGSYGKTSTKFILGTILSEKYHVLVPPSSYNTPMGLTRVIRENLENTHEVFIAEMGARHKGDIAELVELVKPKYGILTSIGPQHLETFGTIETIVETKYELIKGLPEDGIGFFVNDHGYVKERYDQTEIEKCLYALVDEDTEYDVAADEIKTTPTGSSFVVRYGEDKSFTAETKMLGKHNVLNITGCIAIALKLGLSEAEIRRGIAKIEPVEHRLQLLSSANGITVIDDAFNANPEGTRVAMEVLGAFSGRKIVVTPGMVELGEAEEEENRRFGARMAEVADVVFLVGPKHTAPIKAGLEEAGFDTGNIFVVNSLAEASAEMGRMLAFGDVVLFENDLPDNYSEA